MTDLDNPVVRPSRPDSPGNEGAVVDSDEDFVPEQEYRRAKRSKRAVRRAASAPWDITRGMLHIYLSTIDLCNAYLKYIDNPDKIIKQLNVQT